MNVGLYFEDIRFKNCLRLLCNLESIIEVSYKSTASLLRPCYFISIKICPGKFFFILIFYCWCCYEILQRIIAMYNFRVQPITSPKILTYAVIRCPNDCQIFCVAIFSFHKNYMDPYNRWIRARVTLISLEKYFHLY